MPQRALQSILRASIWIRKNLLQVVCVHILQISQAHISTFDNLCSRVYTVSVHARLCACSLRVRCRRQHVIAINCGEELRSLLPPRTHGNKQLAGNTHWLGKQHTHVQSGRHTHTHAHIRNPRKDAVDLWRVSYANGFPSIPLRKREPQETAALITALSNDGRQQRHCALRTRPLTNSAAMHRCSCCGSTFYSSAFTHLMNHQPSRFFWMTSTVTPFSKLTSSFP